MLKGRHLKKTPNDTANRKLDPPITQNDETYLRGLKVAELKEEDIPMV